MGFSRRIHPVRLGRNSRCNFDLSTGRRAANTLSYCVCHHTWIADTSSPPASQSRPWAYWRRSRSGGYEESRCAGIRPSNVEHTLSIVVSGDLRACAKQF